MIGAQPTGANEGVIITAVVHEGLTVTVNGKPARFAIILDDDTIVASGTAVAREAEAVAVNCYRNMLVGNGHLRVLSKPLVLESVVAEPPC
jgi:hypothetical protein